MVRRVEHRLVCKRIAVVGVVAALCSLSCSSDRVTVAEQCPRPQDKRATVELGDGGPAYLFGTSCAPCGKPPRLDKRGCPIFVTFASCGGDICLGGQLIRKPPPPVPNEEDSGAEAELDSGSASMTTEDGGGH